MKQRVTEKAYAKINLTLDVLGKRADGYHDLCSVMQTVCLHDDVTVEVHTHAPWEVLCQWEKPGQTELLPLDGSNLAWRAAEAYIRHTGLTADGVRITLQKRIPTQAGLAGGSADAAAVLRAMNRIAPRPVSVPELCRIGAEVGSDVPFCVMGGTVRCEGRGERLTKLPDAPQMFVVICKPDFSVSTPALYKKLDETCIEKRPDEKMLLEGIESGSIQTMGSSLCNVFEPVVMQQHPEIGRICALMREHGAAGAQMTGSGSAVFGIFADEEYANAACAVMKKEYSQVFLAETV